MTFVSYAQNFEDVTLWRALRDVTDGFYIDVGAWDPDQDSVTRAFSDRGWHGVNLEPVPEKQASLRQRRPRDINLALAVGEAEGTLDFFEITGTGLSTFDREAATGFAAQGYAVVPHSVEQTTLAVVFARHAPPETHFLKLDCEGHEAAALAGCDFTRHRPWIVLVEATLPGTQVPSHAGWEPLLLAARYGFAWFDGLNRFYVAEEHFDRLAPLLAQPPNCFDGFIRAIDMAPGSAPVLSQQSDRATALAPPVWGLPQLSMEQRIDLATQCRDCDDVPKVPEAGSVQDEGGIRVQIMHNGLRVPEDGYCGPWMTDLIRRCRGHHEPQEERQFHAALQTMPADATMIELGSNWAFYSAWFLQDRPARRAFLLEPDPANRAVGQATMTLNGLRAEFHEGVAAAAPGPTAPFVTERSGTLLLPRLSVPQLMTLHGLDRLDILHCDIQGAELPVLESCRALFRAGRIGCVFVSTHAPFITDDPITHQRCLEVLQSCGATIVAEHDPWESFSGDGLIFARFGEPGPLWQPVPCSVARHRQTLFRDIALDLAPAIAAARDTRALLEGVVHGVFDKLLGRAIDPAGLAASVHLLQSGIDFGTWLQGILQSAEFKARRANFGEAWLGEGADTAFRSLPHLPPGSPVTCSAVELTLDRDTALGRTGDRVTVPNDRMILPAILSAGAWLPGQLDVFAARVRTDTSYVLLDIGANIGLFARQAIQTFPNVTIAHCVEPHPANHRALDANMAGLGALVFTHRFALGTHSGTVTLFADDENCGNNSIHPDAMRDRPFQQLTAEMVAAGPWLTRLLPGGEPILWKSDTQGNDEAIVAATPWPVWSRVQVAVLELWRIRKPAPWMPDFLARIADMPHRRLGNRDVTVAEVERYLDSDDWTFEDLYLWR